jgi:hypothetical protein
MSKKFRNSERASICELATTNQNKLKAISLVSGDYKYWSMNTLDKIENWMLFTNMQRYQFEN